MHGVNTNRVTDPAAGSDVRAGTRVTYVGHATIAIETAGARLLTDPLLRRRVLGFLRRRHPLPDLDEIGPLDAVLISHFHHDHLDMRSLRRFRPLGTPIVVPSGGRTYLERRGYERVIELPIGERTRIAEADITAVPAVHGGGLARPGGGNAEFIGYVVEDGVTIYFAGDTDFFDGFAEIGEFGIDVALVPIWGWGAKLGSGHLDPEGAVRALKLLKPRIAVPIHWGTYSPFFSKRLWPWLLTGPVTRFAELAAEEAPEVEVRVLQPGETLELSGAADGSG